MPGWTNADRDRLAARREVWAPLLDAPLGALYGDAAASVKRRLLDTATAGAKARPTELRRRDIAREADPTWFEAATQIGYVAYAERFGGTLRGVAERLNYLAELHVTYLHLMKVLRSRQGANDGGYAVADYHDVEAALGTWDDLTTLAGELHERGISLCVDVVMNHTAREHAWAAAARDGSAKHRAYYLTFPDRTMPDRYEATLPEVFPEIAPGSFTWDDDLAAWVWTTFNSYQWDLNYANPDVLVEMLQVMIDLANAGVDVLRLDAVAFTWKRMGTNCQNQPEAHHIAQVYRALLAIAAPASLLKAEAIVAPADLLPYLGVHHLQRPECQLAYHNQLMVNLWSALATADGRLATASIEALPPTPPSATWVNYVRCHDDIGWAISDDAAARCGLHGAAHRSFLARYYRGDYDGSFADGVAFSSNPDNGDERTCGTAAALCGVGRAQRRGDAAALDQAMRRLRLVYSVMFGLAGIPLIYMGDELALDNDVAYATVAEHADDSRWIHRPAMPWDHALRRTDAATVPGRMFATMLDLVAARRGSAAMSAGGDTWIQRLPDPALFAWARRHPSHGRMYGVANFAPRDATMPAEALGWAGITRPVTIYGADDLRDAADGGQVIRAYGVAWFVDAADGALQPATSS